MSSNLKIMILFLIISKSTSRGKLTREADEAGQASANAESPRSLSRKAGFRSPGRESLSKPSSRPLAYSSNHSFPKLTR